MDSAAHYYQKLGAKPNIVLGLGPDSAPAKVGKKKRAKSQAEKDRDALTRQWRVERGITPSVASDITMDYEESVSSADLTADEGTWRFRASGKAHKQMTEEEIVKRSKVSRGQAPQGKEGRQIKPPQKRRKRSHG